MHPDAEQVGTLHRPLQKRSIGQRKQPVLMLMLPKHKGLMGGSLHHSFPSFYKGTQRMTECSLQNERSFQSFIRRPSAWGCTAQSQYLGFRGFLNI